MSTKKSFMQRFKLLIAVFAIIGISPFILAKLGFWDIGFADTPDFKPAYETIETGDMTFSYAKAVDRVAPSVVSISSKKEIPAESHPLLRDPLFRQFFGDPRAPQGSQPSIGSGVIVTQDGYVLTNNHVVTGADEITVKLGDGRSAEAQLIGTDPETDLAILKIDLKDLPVVALGDSDKLSVGDVVLAFGNPFGVGQTVTQGIVSATQRSSMGISTFENFIQTDAAINPGNSGGPLTDPYGNLVGINNAIITQTGGYQGIGFAIPVNSAKDVMGQLIDKGHVTRGWLGISVRTLSDELRKSLDYPEGEGAVIASIMRGGPAHQAGLQPGDIIISVDNQDTKDPNDVLRVTSKLTPEKPYPLAVVRENQIHDFRVIVGKRPIKDERKNNKDKEKALEKK